jgi:isopenicillin-N epimerase
LRICIDGPHALGIVPLNLRQLDCDFYTASCHKWISAPLGSGFLYAHRRVQAQIQPVVISWGASVGGHPSSWRDEFYWQGTRDLTSNLAVPAALDFLDTAGWSAFRERVHSLAQYAREQIAAATGLRPLVPDSPKWYGSMISLPIPAHHRQPPAQGKRDPLQDALWERERIEAPIVWWKGERMVRVSCHLYTTTAELDLLRDTLAALLKEDARASV